MYVGNTKTFQEGLYENQEETLQFNSFDCNDAWEVGNILVNNAKKDNLAVVIDISIAGQTVFKYSFNGANSYNDQWIERKKNSVMLNQMSSIRFAESLKRMGKFDAIGRYLDPAKYAVCGGGFPIIIRNTGVIGCVAVSGLVDTDDHLLIVNALDEYKNR